MNDNLKIAWMAGFIDGEGSIGLNKEYDKRKGEGYFVYRPTLQIVNTNEESIKIFYDHIGIGDIRFIKARDNSHQAIYRYVLRAQEPLLKFLREIEPYLIIKKQRAKLLIHYIENRITKPGRGRYNPRTALDNKIWGDLMLMNLRGLQARIFNQTI